MSLCSYFLWIHRGLKVNQTSGESFILPFRKKTYYWNERTLIMGILNVTRESFSDGGKFFSFENAVAQGMQLVDDGADILDIGGESTRPGSKPLEEEEEIRRVIPVIRELARNIFIPISVDTRKAKVAALALKAGAEMINDISALRYDSRMADLVAAQQVPVVLMHMRGTPETMQIDPHYDDLIGEIRDFFAERLTFAAKKGISEEQVILDPGIGFGKSNERKHNLILLKHLSSFAHLKRPLLVGPSRKAFIGSILGLPPEDREEGSMGAVAVAICSGANMVRVHEVKKMRRVVQMVDAIIRCS
jgi:dihydropteroate synthase